MPKRSTTQSEVQVQKKLSQNPDVKFSQTQIYGKKKELKRPGGGLVYKNTNKDENKQNEEKQNTVNQTPNDSRLDGGNQNFSVARATEQSVDMFSRQILNNHTGVENTFGEQFYIPEVPKRQLIDKL